MKLIRGNLKSVTFRPSNVIPMSSWYHLLVEKFPFKPTAAIKCIGLDCEILQIFQILVIATHAVAPLFFLFFLPREHMAVNEAFFLVSNITIHIMFPTILFLLTLTTVAN